MRYIRQTTLPEVGIAGQEKLNNAHVLVVGAGGLGVPVLQYLVGAGVGHITLVDADTVEESNLHRQPLYRMDDIGKKKVQAAAASLQGLNPAVRITPIAAWLDPPLARTLIKPADVVLDCADNFAVSYTLSDACLATRTPLITASALYLNGYVAGVCGTAPSLRAIFSGLPSNAPTCASAGILGPVVGTLGMLQAQMTLAVLLKQSPSPLGQLLNFSAADWRFSNFRFDQAPEPKQALPFIGAQEFQPTDMLIDLRTEARQPFHAKAQHISVDNLTQLNTPVTAQRLVVGCVTGLRAYHAATQLQTHWQGDIALFSIPPTN